MDLRWRVNNFLIHDQRQFLTWYSGLTPFGPEQELLAYYMTCEGMGANFYNFLVIELLEPNPYIQ